MRGGSALIGMAASLVAGVADLGLLNLSLVPRAFAVAESSVPTPATSPEPAHPSNARGAAAPRTGVEVEANAAGAETIPKEMAIDSQVPAAPAALPVADIATAVAPPSPQGNSGDSGGPSDVVASAGVKEAPAAASQDAEANKSAPSAPQGASELVLLFPTGDNNLTPEARASLQEFAAALRDDASAFVIVEGHADERGRSEVNRELAAARADAVAARLERLSFPRSRIKVDSFGEDRPVAEAQSDEALQQNRRVVVRVTRGRP